MVYIFLAEGFEEIEALAPLDLLRRAGVEVKTIGVGSRTVVGSHSIPVVADMLDSELCDGTPEMVILPGGMPGTLNLNESKVVHKAIRSAIESGAYVCAICAAPLILGRLGLLTGKEAICYPGFEDELVGATISGKTVAVDGKIITAKGMGAAIDFGLTLVAILKGNEVAENLRKSTISE